jgi:hypothetical protein
MPLNDEKSKRTNNTFKNNNIYPYENAINELNQNQSLSNNERILNEFNKKLFMTEENTKEDVIFNNNSRNHLKVDDNDYDYLKKNNSFMTEPIKFMNNNNRINDLNLKNINNINNISVNSNNNNSILNDIDLIYNSNNQGSKTEYRPKVLSQNIDYAEYLKKQYFDSDLKNDEDNNDIIIKLESNNKELLKKCEDLIEDNKLLNSELNDRTSKLNKIIQENIVLKSEYNKIKLNVQKYEQKIIFYEEQLNLYKTNIQNYQKIINELQNQKEKIKNKYNENSENDFKNLLKEEILNIKKNLEEITSQNKMKNNIKNNENEQQDLKNINYEEIKIYKEKNEELNKQIDLMNIENQKLLEKNKLIDTYLKQINGLNEIIKNKDILINSLKEKDQNIILSENLSYSNNDKKEIYNENISKLINDNQENKAKIELLNEKLKSFDIMEKKYNELVKKNNELSNDDEKAKNEIKDLKNSQNKLIEEKTKLNKKVNEYEKKLENVISENKNLTIELKEKQNEIEKLKKELDKKDRLFTNLKNESQAQKQEYEISIKKYKDEIIEKNNIINNLNNENKLKDSSINELNNKISEKDYIINNMKKSNNNNITKNEINTNIIKKENNKNSFNNNDDNNIKINEENVKKEEIKEEIKIEENKVERKYMSSLRNRFLRKREEEKKLKEKEKEKEEEKEKEKENKINENNEDNLKKDNNIDNKIEAQIEEKNDEKESEKEKIKIDKNEEDKTNHGNKFEEEKDEVKESIRYMNRRKNYTHKPKLIKDINIEIKEEKIIDNTYYLYGIDRNDYFHIFDINNKKWDKMKVSEIKLDEMSSTFRKDYQYEGTIIYNTLEGVYMLTGEKTDTLYYFNSKNNIISKICKFNTGHDNGSLLVDEKSNILYVFGGKKIKCCEYYNFNEKKIKSMPDLIIDRANASFIISNNKIFGFFGFSYDKNNYANSIEYIDNISKEKWIEIKNVNILEKDISFDIESIATMYYKNNDEEILLYSGIKGEEEDFITDYYLIYNTKNNSISKIKAWNIKQHKTFGKKWRDYTFKKSDQKGFHFAKNTRFLTIDKIEGLNDMNILIDYKNNVHFIEQSKEIIDIYRGNI